MACRVACLWYVVVGGVAGGGCNLSVAVVFVAVVIVALISIVGFPAVTAAFFCLATDGIGCEWLRFHNDWQKAVEPTMQRLTLPFSVARPVPPASCILTNDPPKP